MAPIYKNFIYNEERGFIFAYVPKVACTNWKSLLRYMAGHADWLDNKLAHDKEKGGLHYLDLETGDAALLNSPVVKKFAMVRNPYSRVLSAYLNKVEGRLPPKPEAAGEDHFDKVVRDIDAFRRDRLGADFPEITFEVFLHWLRDSGSWFVNDEHWAPQVALLRYPEVTYTFIGRFENLDTDAGQMLQEMGCDKGFPSQKDVKFAPTNAKSKVDLYFNDACYALVNEIFHQDFLAFSYPMQGKMPGPAAATPRGPAKSAQAGGRIIAVASFPKSGNTWIRSIIGSTFDLKMPQIPDIYKQDFAKAGVVSDTRFFKTHAGSFKTLVPGTDEAVTNAIHIRRNPLDVFLSYMNFLSDNVTGNAPIPFPSVEAIVGTDLFDMYFDTFIVTGHLLMNAHALETGTYFKSNLSWLDAAAKNANILCIKYEDLTQDPLAALKEFRAWFDLPEETFAAGLQQADTATKQDGKFFWRRKSKNFQDILTDDQMGRFLKYRSEDSRRLGYDQDFFLT